MSFYMIFKRSFIKPQLKNCSQNTLDKKKNLVLDLYISIYMSQVTFVIKSKIVK